MKRAISTLVVLLVFTPTLAVAHPGHGGTTGFLHGLVHPVTGTDHILAMIAVGFLAAQYGGRALWLIPMSFLAAMTVAGAVGIAGIHVQIAEVGIALSVAILGLVIAFQFKPPMAVALTAAGFFALFHGYVHGAETIDGTGALSFAAGFLSATTLLLCAGVGLGLLLRQQALSRRLIQAGGGVMALFGVAMLAGFL